ncbi:hypothetical protein ACJRO7_003936, partial [Eucalyptus globulus]
MGRGDATDRFVVDCKNIYLAGYKTTALAASWTLMLLALNPGWQAKVREEVMQVTQVLRGGQLPNADTIRKMKTVSELIPNMNYLRRIYGM